MAVGDIIPGGNMIEPLLGRGTEWARADLVKIFKGGDLIIGNLECPITDRKKSRPGQLFSLKMPRTLAPLLTAFDGVSIANNHILDFGLEGLIDTINHLNCIGVKHCGAGYSLSEAMQPVVFDLDGFSVGMISFTDRNWYPSGPTTPGTYTWQDQESSNVITTLSQDADFVIVQIHQGYEFLDYPGPEELAAVQQVIDAGADLVLCHHSHTLMGIARKGRAVVAYGLGNFVCENNMHTKHLLKVRRRAVFCFQIDKHKVLDWRVVPLVPDEIGWPVLATGEDFLSIHQHIKKISSILDNEVETIRQFRRQAGEIMLPHAFRSLTNLLRKEGLGPVLARFARLRWVDLSVVFHRLYSSIKAKT